MDLFQSESLVSFVILLFIEASKIVIVTSLLVLLFKSPSWRRYIWQACQASIVLLLLLEISGVGRKISSSYYGADTSWSPKELFSFQSSPETKRLEVSYAGLSSATNLDNPVVLMITCIWFVGSIYFLLKNFLPRLLTVRFLSRCDYVRNRFLIDTLEELCRKLDIARPVLLLQSDSIKSPMTLGVHRPVIVLPKNMEAKFTLWQQKAIIAHELGHVRSRDAFWHMIHDTIQVLIWWHPLIWFAGKQNDISSETAADNAALVLPNGGLHLADSLVAISHSIADVKSDHSQRGLHITGSHFKSLLARRVNSLLGHGSQNFQEPKTASAMAFQVTYAISMSLFAVICIA